MEVLQTLGVALGLASLAGINLYLTVFVTGLAVRMQWVVVPPQLHDLGMLGDPIIIGVAGFLYFVEFFADKVPWIDTAWDSVHTFIRPVGAAAVAVAALGDSHPAFEIVGALLAGGMALTTHVAKAGTRLVANGSPEPVSNIGLSLAEDGIVLAGLALIAWNAIAALVRMEEAQRPAGKRHGNRTGKQAHLIVRGAASTRACQQGSGPLGAALPERRRPAPEGKYERAPC